MDSGLRHVEVCFHIIHSVADHEKVTSTQVAVAFGEGACDIFCNCELIGGRKIWHPFPIVTEGAKRNHCSLEPGPPNGIPLFSSAGSTLLKIKGYLLQPQGLPLKYLLPLY